MGYIQNKMTLARIGRICKLNCFLKIPLEKTNMEIIKNENENSCDGGTAGSSKVAMVLRPVRGGSLAWLTLVKQRSYCHRRNSFLIFKQMNTKD